MSMMAYCVLDANRALHSCRHGSFIDQLIPALCDDPETIDEKRCSGSHSPTATPVLERTKSCSTTICSDI